MADETMQAKLKPLPEDHPARGMVAALIDQHHPSLKGATIALFFKLGKGESWWGITTIATEETWWLSRTDLVVQINRALWDGLPSDSARAGLLDHLLSTVSAKDSGQTKMETDAGIRQLYQPHRPSLSVHPEVMARNVDFVKAIPELARLNKALAEPKQFLLEFTQEKQSAAGGSPN